MGLLQIFVSCVFGVLLFDDKPHRVLFLKRVVVNRFEVYPIAAASSFIQDILAAVGYQ